MNRRAKDYERYRPAPLPKLKRCGTCKNLWRQCECEVQCFGCLNDPAKCWCGVTP